MSTRLNLRKIQSIKCSLYLMFILMFIQNFMPAGLPDGMTQYGTSTPICLSGKAALCRE